MRFHARLAARNLAALGTLSGGAWADAAGLGLGMLLDDRLVTHPARCLDVTTVDDDDRPTGSRLTLTFPRRQRVDRVNLFTTTLSRDARYWVEFYDDAGATEVLRTSGWRDVFGRIYSTAGREWEDVNWWDGRVTEEDLDTYPRNLLHVEAASVSCRALTLWLDDRGRTADLDIGYLYVAADWQPTYNYDLGAGHTMGFRDVVDELPSGYRQTERRRPRRGQRVTFSDLSKDEALRLYDIGMRAGQVDPVVFAPDPTDLRHGLRETYLAVLADPTEPVRWSPRYWRVTLSITELIA